MNHSEYDNGAMLEFENFKKSFLNSLILSNFHLLLATIFSPSEDPFDRRQCRGKELGGASYTQKINFKNIISADAAHTQAT